MPFTTQKQKKKPPPRPPPPNFSRYKSKSTYNLNQPNQTVNLIDWSPPASPKADGSRHFGGSISSSFSSSTSSLASSKKSFEFDIPITNNVWPLQPQTTTSQSTGGATFQSYLTSAPNNTSTKIGNGSNLTVPSIFGPTIIRPRAKPNVKVDNVSPLSGSPPMPNIPPPSPPKEEAEIETPYGIALYDYQTNHQSDLALQAGDVVILLRRISTDWIYGRVLDKKGMFPETFIDIQVPLKGEENIVTALYDFPMQMPGDLSLKAGQKVKVIRKISDDWLFGESVGRSGQFPSNFVTRVPKNV